MNSDQARQRVQQSFKQGESALDSRKLLTEYETKARATREKIARLKALRLAKETQVQAEQPQEPSSSTGNNKRRLARRDK